MKSYQTLSEVKTGGPQAASQALFNPPPKGRILLSPDNSKLCFELLECFSAAQNHLPCRELKTPSEVGVF